MSWLEPNHKILIIRGRPSAQQETEANKMRIHFSATSIVIAAAALAFGLSTNYSVGAATARAPQQSGAAAPSNPSSSTAAKKKAHHRHSAKRQSFQKAPTPERISEIQSALARGGYYQGEPNGKWDSNTVSALEKFQSDNGMNASGKLDAPSLQKLGLGSSTAGVDAPKPVSHTTPGASPTGSAPTPAAATNSASASNVTPTPTTPAASSASATPKQQRR
jgi:peptidoglycan hydrolase-like protein with peptidoglycan-binding domain